MKIWKVIFATLVIFSAGLVTGSFLSRDAKPVAPTPVRQDPAPPVPYLVQERFLMNMKRELSLTPEQVSRLKAVFEDSRARMRILMDLINPELQAEKREVADRIRAELTPEQLVKFEELIKRAHREPENRPRRPGDRKTNAATAKPQQ